jgi:hypothetical protein
VERSLGGARSVVQDPVFERSLDGLDRSPTMLIAACPGRCAEMALPFAPPREREQIVPLIDMLGRTAFSAVVQHSDTRLALRARLQEMPDVSGMVAQALSARKRAAAQYATLASSRTAAPARVVEASGGQVRTVAATEAVAAKQAQASAQAAKAKALKEAELAKKAEAEAKARALKEAELVKKTKADAKAKAVAGSGGPQELRTRLEACVEKGDLDTARRLGDRIAATSEDATWLNDFAWALLTDEPFAGQVDDVALALSRRSNELSGNANWYHLDTLALAEFRNGHLRRAVELQADAVERASGDPRQAEAVERLKRYTAALREEGPIVQAGGGGDGG